MALVVHSSFAPGVMHSPVSHATQFNLHDPFRALSPHVTSSDSNIHRSSIDFSRKNWRVGASRHQFMGHYQHQGLMSQQRHRLARCVQPRAMSAFVTSYLQPQVSNIMNFAAAALDLNVLAKILGYIVGAGSLLLYTPIILSLLSSKGENVASGLALSTWWLKLAAYTATDAYCINKGFPISTYVETLIVTGQAALLVLLVGGRQNRLNLNFAGLAVFYLAVTVWALTSAPSQALSIGQAAASLTATLAILPQLRQNMDRRDSGYSPITAGLACGGCAIRLFTTMQLAGGDPLLLAGYILAFVLNSTLLAQILYYGLVVRQRSLTGVLMVDTEDKNTKDDDASKKMAQKDGTSP